MSSLFFRLIISAIFVCTCSTHDEDLANSRAADAAAKAAKAADDKVSEDRRSSQREAEEKEKEKRDWVRSQWDESASADRHRKRLAADIQAGHEPKKQDGPTTLGGPFSGPAVPIYNPSRIVPPLGSQDFVYYRRLKRRRLWCGCLVACLIILGASPLIVFGVLNPHQPEFSFGDTIVKSFNISMNSTLQANMVYKVTAYNPNERIVIKHDGIIIDTFVRPSNQDFLDNSNEHLIDTSSIPAFEQGPHDVTTFSLEFKVDNLALPQSVMTDLAYQLRNDDFLVRTRARADVRMKFGSLTSLTAFWRLRTTCNVVIPPTNSSHPFTSNLYTFRTFCSQ